MRRRVALIGAGMIPQHHVDKWRAAGADGAAVVDAGSADLPARHTCA